MRAPPISKKRLMHAKLGEVVYGKWHQDGFILFKADPNHLQTMQDSGAIAKDKWSAIRTPG